MAKLAHLGADVHYVAYGTPGGEYPKACRAAKITALDFPREDSVVTLFVMNPTGTFHNSRVPHDAGTAGEPFDIPHCCGGLSYAGGTWHWPAETEH